MQWTGERGMSGGKEKPMQWSVGRCETERAPHVASLWDPGADELALAGSGAGSKDGLCLCVWLKQSTSTIKPPRCLHCRRPPPTPPPPSPAHLQPACVPLSVPCVTHCAICQIPSHILFPCKKERQQWLLCFLANEAYQQNLLHRPPGELLIG